MAISDGIAKVLRELVMVYPWHEESQKLELLSLIDDEVPPPAHGVDVVGEVPNVNG